MYSLVLRLLESVTVIRAQELERSGASIEEINDELGNWEGTPSRRRMVLAVVSNIRSPHEHRKVGIEALWRRSPSDSRSTEPSTC